MSGEMHARTLGEAIAKVRANWGWFVALGVGLLMLGVIAVANLLTATVASVLLVGVMMLMGGVAQIVLGRPYVPGVVVHRLRAGASRASLTGSVLGPVKRSEPAEW